MGGHGREYATAFIRLETSNDESFVVLSRSAADMQRMVVWLVNFAVIRLKSIIVNCIRDKCNTVATLQTCRHLSYSKTDTSCSGECDSFDVLHLLSIEMSARLSNDK